MLSYNYVSNVFLANSRRYALLSEAAGAQTRHIKGLNNAHVYLTAVDNACVHSGFQKCVYCISVVSLLFQMPVWTPPFTVSACRLSELSFTLLRSYVIAGVVCCMILHNLPPALNISFFLRHWSIFGQFVVGIWTGIILLHFTYCVVFVKSLFSAGFSNFLGPRQI